jgi:hypothetical protein
MKRQFFGALMTCVVAAVAFLGTWRVTSSPVIVHAQAPTKAKVAPPAPSGPTPHLANGRADFSGLWRPGDIFLIEPTR